MALLPITPLSSQDHLRTHVLIHTLCHNKTKRDSKIARALRLGCLLGSALSLSGCYPERVESVRLMNQGIQLYNAGQKSDAVKVLERAGEIDATNHRAMFYQGMILNNIGQFLAERGEGRAQFREAVDALKNSVKVRADDAEALFQLGVAQEALGRDEEALLSFARASQVEAHGQSYYRSAEIHSRLERYNKAQDQYHSAIIAQPSLGVSYTALSKLYRRFKRLNEAVQVLKNAVVNDPGEVGHYRDLGELYGELKQHTRAIKYLQEALKIDPSQKVVLFLLGETYAQIEADQSAVVYLNRYIRSSIPASQRYVKLKAQKLLKQIKRRRR